MNQIETLIARVQQTTHGFTDIRRAADELEASNSADSRLSLAQQLSQSDVPQARMLATFLMGRLAASDANQLTFLRQQVSRDADWRVQEILAQAFDQYCKDTGYEAALSVIDLWLHDDHANVRRAVTEGLRIWTSRPYFKSHPEAAIQRLSALRADSSEYVRKSVGNALRDISRKHAALIQAELSQWDQSDTLTRLTYRLAAQFLETPSKD
jgi:3-methyladenine DNA glycosylase AlkC